MTEDEVIDLTLEATGMKERDLPRFRILALVNLARTQLADQVAASGDREERELLRKTFDLTFTAGTASLSTALNATEPLLLKYLNTAEIRLAGLKRRLTLLPDESAVKRDHIAGFPFGAVIGDTVLAYNGGQPFAGSGSLRAAYVPTLENIKTPLTERFITIISGMVTGRIPTNERRAVQEMKAVAAEGK